MIRCICNNISENDIQQDPSLEKVLGSCCGLCVEPPARRPTGEASVCQAELGGFDSRTGRQIGETYE